MAVTSALRMVELRGILSSERNALPDEISAFEESDKIPNMNALTAELKLRYLSLGFHLIEQDCQLTLVKFSENIRSIYCSVTIKSDFSVFAFHRNTDVYLRDLLGFQCKLERWSQLDNIINRVKQQELDIIKEATAALEYLRELLDSSEFNFFWNSFI